MNFNLEPGTDGYTSTALQEKTKKSVEKIEEKESAFQIKPETWKSYNSMFRYAYTIPRHFEKLVGLNAKENKENKKVNSKLTELQESYTNLNKLIDTKQDEMRVIQREISNSLEEQETLLTSHDESVQELEKSPNTKALLEAKPEKIGEYFGDDHKNFDQLTANLQNLRDKMESLKHERDSLLNEKNEVEREMITVFQETPIGKIDKEIFEIREKLPDLKGEILDPSVALLNATDTWTSHFSQKNEVPVEKRFKSLVADYALRGENPTIDNSLKAQEKLKLLENKEEVVDLLEKYSKLQNARMFEIAIRQPDVQDVPQLVEKLEKQRALFDELTKVCFDKLRFKIENTKDHNITFNPDRSELALRTTLRDFKEIADDFENIKQKNLEQVNSFFEKNQFDDNEELIGVIVRDDGENHTHFRPAFKIGGKTIEHTNELSKEISQLKETLTSYESSLSQIRNNLSELENRGYGDGFFDKIIKKPSTEKYNQSHKLLLDSIEDTKNKIASLKEEIDQKEVVCNARKSNEAKLSETILVPFFKFNAKGLNRSFDLSDYGERFDVDGTYEQAWFPDKGKKILWKDFKNEIKEMTEKRLEEIKGELALPQDVIEKINEYDRNLPLIQEFNKKRNELIDQYAQTSFDDTFKK